MEKVFALLSNDIVFLCLLVLIFLGYAMYFGKGRIIALILSFYPATILYNSFPFINKLTMTGDAGMVWGKIGVFLVFFIPLNILIGKYIYSDSFYMGGDTVFRNAGLAIAGVLLVVLFSYNTVNFDVLHNFSPSIDAIFSGSDRTFWWNLAPLVLLGVL